MDLEWNGYLGQPGVVFTRAVLVNVLMNREGDGRFSHIPLVKALPIIMVEKNRSIRSRSDIATESGQ